MSEEHIRALLNVGPTEDIGLECLVDPPPGERPDYALPTLVKLAIFSSPKKRLTLQEIYQALQDRFEWYKENDAWKNSIRHSLSLRSCFRKVTRPITEPGKGCYWTLDLSQGEGNKRVRKR
ncbi:winged helix DNA-binding domain-containing protein, partial [Stereum hirsutum FP-91666 SS1]|uniref:winged helix DNA-binding domain-containing protein n=1 Tax=Stereum hirsutum (strain FP-91666) TaxID=721885 RepID=UPI00044105E5